MHAPELKPGNAARCHWQHAADIRTPLALLYLHSFSASPGEAGALPEQMADALAANAYVHRWPGHGLSTADAMQGLTAAVLQTSALEALAQAQRMGERIAIIGSSMGATLGFWLAAQRPDAVAAVVAWSPGRLVAWYPACRPGIARPGVCRAGAADGPAPAHTGRARVLGGDHPSGWISRLVQLISGGCHRPTLATGALPGVAGRLPRRRWSRRCDRLGAGNAGYVCGAGHCACTQASDCLRQWCACDRVAAQDAAGRCRCAGVRRVLARAAWRCAADGQRLSKMQCATVAADADRSACVLVNTRC